MAQAQASTKHSHSMRATAIVCKADIGSGWQLDIQSAELLHSVDFCPVYWNGQKAGWGLLGKAVDGSLEITVDLSGSLYDELDAAVLHGGLYLLPEIEVTEIHIKAGVPTITRAQITKLELSKSKYRADSQKIAFLAFDQMDNYR